MPKRKLSAVIITFNEEKCIAECLDALQFCDEIVVVDSESTDATVDICKSFGARVICQPWLGFGPQKHFAVEQAAYDWVVCVDADEVISSVLRESIQAEMSAPAKSVYQMPRCNRFLGRALRHGEGYPDLSLRLFDRSEAQWSLDAVHEKVETVSSVGVLRGDLIHNSAETLEKYLATQNSYTSIQAQALFIRGKRVGVAKLLLSPLTRFVKFYFFKRGFLDGIPGLVHILIGCMNAFVKYSKVYEKQLVSSDDSKGSRE